MAAGDRRATYGTMAAGDVYDKDRRATCMTRIAGYITHGTRYNEKRSSEMNSFSSAPPGSIVKPVYQ